MKNIFTAIVLLILCKFSIAQSPILTEVRIEFERKVNVWANMGAFGDQMKNSTPQFTSSFYSYETDESKSLYKPIPKEDNNRYSFFSITTENTVFTDLKAKEQVSLKSVFDKTYLVTDSLRHIDWKITNEFREIAGFNCRRATAIILDSVFVVAFYSNEIMPSGGPESFTGLPGMILGLVINRLHTTWYATKVNVTDINSKNIVPPIASKAEKTNRSKLGEILKQRFQGSGRFGSDNSMIWQMLI